MTIRYNTDAESFAFLPAKCQHCGGELWDTGCDAPRCDSRLCPECGAGCDIEIEPETGRCATALAEESDEDYTARINGERAAFGLSPLSTREQEATPAPRHYDCCEHCEHDINDPPHDVPCPEGCTEDCEEGPRP